MISEIQFQISEIQFQISQIQFQISQIVVVGEKWPMCIFLRNFFLMKNHEKHYVKHATNILDAKIYLYPY